MYQFNADTSVSTLAGAIRPAFRRDAGQRDRMVTPKIRAFVQCGRSVIDVRARHLLAMLATVGGGALLAVAGNALAADSQITAQAVVDAAQVRLSDASVDRRWVNVGPGGGGWTQSIAWDPVEPDTLHVGSDVGGYYLSTNGGRTFELRNNGLRDYFIASIAIHPQNNRTIVIGTKGGIYKTTDRGANWRPIRVGFPPLSKFRLSAPISSVSFAPSNPQILYAGVGYTRRNKGRAGSVYRSDDSGESWRNVGKDKLPAKALVHDVAVHPGNDSIVLAATDHGLFRSDDSGQSWSKMQHGLTNHHPQKIAFSPSVQDVVYATFRTTVDKKKKVRWDGGVFRSDDAGLSWRDVTGKGLPRTVGNPGQNRKRTSSLGPLTVSLSNPDTLYTAIGTWAGAGVYTSNDGGQSWSWMTRFPQGRKLAGLVSNVERGWVTQWGVNVKAMALNPHTPGVIAIGTGGHVLVTDDAGASWRNAFSVGSTRAGHTGNGLENTVVFDVIGDPVTKERFAVCYWDIGLMFSDDNGVSFKRRTKGMMYPQNCFRLIIDKDRPQIMWAATGSWHKKGKGALEFSDDGGESWRTLNKSANNRRDALPLGRITSLEIDYSSDPGHRRLVAAVRSKGLYESRDAGVSWVSIGAGLPQGVRKRPGVLALDSGNPEHMVVAIYGPHDKGGGLYRTLDAGQTWRRVSDVLPFFRVEDLEFDPLQTNSIYVAARKSKPKGTSKPFGGGVYRVDLQRGTANRVLEHDRVSSIAVNPVSKTLYASTSYFPSRDRAAADGVLRSRDGGKTWVPFNEGMTLLNVNVVSVHPTDPSWVYAGTSGNGAFIRRDR